jgi:hypothetical protein
MLKAWFAPFLGPKTHLFYVRLSVLLGYSAPLVSKSDQGTHFDQPDSVQILSFKTILSNFKSFMKVVILDV